MGLVQKTFTQKMSTELARQVQKEENFRIYIYFKGYLSKFEYKVLIGNDGEEFNRFIETKGKKYEVITSEEFNKLYQSKRTIGGISKFLYNYVNLKINELEKRIEYDGVYVSVLEYKNNEVFEDSLSVDFYQRVREEGNVMYLVKLDSESYGNAYKGGVYTLVRDTYTPDMLRRMPKDNLIKVYKNKDGTYIEVIGKDKDGKEVKSSLNLKRYKGESYKETSKNKKRLKPPIN